MKRFLSLMIVLISGSAVCAGYQHEYQRAVIETRIGTAPGRSVISGKFNSEAGEGQGKTIPCVTEPHGMTFWTPQTRISERKGVQPYSYRDTAFLGFRASHWLVGGATQDYGSFYVRPDDGPVALDHESETAAPEYYSLGGYELTGRSHSAIMRMSGAHRFVVGLINEYGEGTITYDAGRHEITGSNPVHRIYAGKGQPAGFSGHFVLRFDSTPISVELLGDGRSLSIVFDGNAPCITFKAGCSFTSVEGARANLDAEIPHWDFARTRDELASIWGRQLSVIDAVTADDDLRNQFYSSLWRASLLPRTASDVDGSYPAFGSPELNEYGTLKSLKPVMKMPEGKIYYDDFSVWDTYRALHPLLNIISPSVNGDMVQSLVLKAQQGGWMPIFPCWGSYTSAMIGYHTFSIICDAWGKGVGGFDRREAYRHMRRLAFGHPSEAEYKDGRGIRALDSYEKYGYIPLEDEVPDAFHRCEQMSRTLEYAYDDYVLSRVALRTLHFRDWLRLRKRAQNWKNVYDPSTGFVQGRHEDGTFLTEDNLLIKPRFITEGTPMHYSWYVPHDVEGLKEVMSSAGGDFRSRLDTMFDEWYYWHGNEPCHQVAYLYDYTDTPYRLQKLVREILHSEYSSGPSCLSGNDDAGQMAAWYVFSTMGFYPVCPGGRHSQDYAIGSPCFDSLTIHLENGKTFTIVAEGTSDSCCYIQEGRLSRRQSGCRDGCSDYSGSGCQQSGYRNACQAGSENGCRDDRQQNGCLVGSDGRCRQGRSGGRRLRRQFLSHRDIMRGGTLTFVMGEEPLR